MRAIGYMLFTHPRHALINAGCDFGVDGIQKNMILSHMFPLSTTLPRCRESMFLCAADKICTVRETFAGVLERIGRKKEQITMEFFDTLCRVIFYFMIYSVVGWIYETTLCSITDRHFVNRGFSQRSLLPDIRQRSTARCTYTRQNRESLSAVYTRRCSSHARSNISPLM